MAAALKNSISQFLSMSWLTGPIFDKELRVSSRRKRNYILRFVYLALMTIFLILIWLEEVRYDGSSVYQVSRMARAGQTIIVFIIWFQFCATQLIAIVMLSTSISDEIHNRTLGVLMSTPINSFQIVIGKLFSKLLQLILLLAISLPLLAIVRVFGGVPWGYLVISLCINLTTLIFVGSLSLFFSIFSRKAYSIIIRTILTMVILFAALPALTAMFWHLADLRNVISDNTLGSIVLYPNPYGNMAYITGAMFNPRGMAGGPTLFWPVHCAIMLGASALMLTVSVIKVRKVALRQALGQLDNSSNKKKNKTKPKQRNHALIFKCFQDHPVLWKELRHPLVGPKKIRFFITLGIGLLLLFSTYLFCIIEGEMDNETIHMAYVSIFMGLGILLTIVLPATSITSEKEARSWPLLLATTLSDWQILFGKFLGAVRRCLPVWILLFGHIIVFSVCSFIHPIAIVQMAILVTWIIVFFCCTGIYFSARFKHTTTAVVMNLALAIVIWAIIPLLMALSMEITHMGDDIVEGYITIIPFVQAVVVIEATVGSGLGSYNWPEMAPKLDALQSTFYMLAFMLGYCFIGFLFAWRAKCLFRRNIF